MFTHAGLEIVDGVAELTHCALEGAESGLGPLLVLVLSLQDRADIVDGPARFGHGGGRFDAGLRPVRDVV